MFLEKLREMISLMKLEYIKLKLHINLTLIGLFLSLSLVFSDC